MHPFYIQQLFQELKRQSEKLEKMDQLLQDLRKDVDGLMSKNSTNIERIEYHFDLLKIEKLEGTLNIGMTQSAGKTIDDVMVNGQTMEQIQTDPKRALMITNIQQAVYAYLEHEIPKMIDCLTEEGQIDSKHKELIIQDIKGQVDARIVLYVDQMESNNTQKLDDASVQDTIVQQVKKDIDVAVKQHIEQTYKGKKDTNETERRE
ncbi:spore germination protein GerPC [Paenibacillus sp. EC2-1]|uniref:spore germination protein GerPC n=1 Tax=Paenibacillus sp. EC2-1 TaxID=3388665 RepID=UPI003BEEE668